MTLTSLISQEQSTTGLCYRPHWVETSPGGARSRGNKEERVRSITMIDMDDSSQSDFSPCRPLRAVNAVRQAQIQRHTVGQGNTHILLRSFLLTPLSCWSLGLHFNAPVTAPSLHCLRHSGGDSTRKKFELSLQVMVAQRPVLHAN